MAFALLCVHPTVSKDYFCHMAGGLACYGRLMLSRNIIQGRVEVGCLPRRDI